MHTLLCALLALLLVPLPLAAQSPPTRDPALQRIDQLGGEVTDALTTVGQDDDERLRILLEAELANLALSDDARARAAYHLGRLGEHFGRAAEAFDRYEQSVALAPSGPHARHALGRIRVLRVRLDAGEDDDARRRLTEIRAGWQDVEATEAAREEIEALLARTHSPVLAAELHFWLASHALFRMHDAQEAWAHYAAVLELSDLPPTLYRNAIDGIIETCADAWRIRASQDAIQGFVARNPDFFDPDTLLRIADEFEDAWQRRVGTFVAWFGFIGVFGVLAWRRAWRALKWTNLRRWRPWRAVLFVAWIIIGAGFFASAWDGPVWIELGIVGVAVSCIAVASGAIHWADPDRPLEGRLRWLVAILILCATFGAVFLPLEKIGREQLLGL